MGKTTSTRPSARERLLAAGDELFYNEGIHAVGIDRVIEKAGVAKGSLYYIFGGKDELIRTYLENRHGRWITKVDNGISGYASPREQILAVFDVLGELFAQPDYRGCAFSNAIAEAQPDSPEVAAASTFRAWVHELFTDLAEATSTEDPALLAERLVVLYDGAVSTSQMDHTPNSAATARQVADLVLTAANVPPTT